MNAEVTEDVLTTKRNPGIRQSFSFTGKLCQKPALLQLPVDQLLMGLFTFCTIHVCQIVNQSHISIACIGLYIITGH